MRTVIVEVKKKLVINADEEASIATLVTSTEESFSTEVDNAEITDSEVLDWDVVDSK